MKTSLNQSSPHVVTLQETFLKTTSEKPYFQNYRFLRIDRPDDKRCGGVAMLIRNDVKFTRSTTYALFPFEICTAAIYTGGRVIKISSLYSPKHTRSFKRRIAAMFTDPDHFVFGDFNARHQNWNGSVINTAGAELFELQLDSGIVVKHPDCHTYMSPTAAPMQLNQPSTTS